MEVGSPAASYLSQLQKLSEESRSVNNARIQADLAERQQMAAAAAQNTLDMMGKRVEATKVDVYA